MSESENERFSEYQIRQQSPEKRLSEARERLEEAFTHSELHVTQAADGSERIRAFIPDEDGYAGWIENANYTGVARITHDGRMKYLVERHYPHAKGKPTYFYEFTPETMTLNVKVDRMSEDTAPLDMPVPADEKYQGYFLQLTREVAHAYRFNDFEFSAHQMDGFTFQLPQLQ